MLVTKVKLILSTLVVTGALQGGSLTERHGIDQVEREDLPGLTFVTVGNFVPEHVLAPTRSVFVLLRSEDFAETNLSKLFAYLSKRFATPAFLSVFVTADPVLLKKAVADYQQAPYNLQSRLPSYLSPAALHPRAQASDNRCASPGAYSAHYFRDSANDREWFDYTPDPSSPKFVRITIKSMAIPYTGRPSHDLPLAAWEDDVDKIVSLAAAGTNINVPDEDGDAPLSLAALASHQEAVTLLLENGADPDVRGQYGQTPMMLAAMNGDEGIIRELISAGADVNARSGEGDHREAALVKAAARGKGGAVRLLLSSGADIDARNSEGSTALMSAAEAGSPSTARVLCEAGAEVNARNNRGETALQLAKGVQATEVKKVLRLFGAK